MAATAMDLDLRLHKRIRPGRPAMLSVDGEWLTCTILDISGGGASIAIDREVFGQSHVVLCDSELGMIAASVERFAAGQLVVVFGIEGTARERLIDQLTGLLNADLM